MTIADSKIKMEQQQDEAEAPREDFFIAVKDEPEFYLPGQKVNLAVHRIIDQAEELIEGMELRCLGRARAEWRAGFSEEYKIGKQHTNEEVYYDYTVKLDTKIDGTKVRDGRLSRGSNVFPATFDLPRNIPCSYKSACGRIEYIFVATLKLAKTAAAAKAQAPVDPFSLAEITIWRPTDLNNFPDSEMPKHLESFSRSWNCAHCSCALLLFKMDFKKTGFLVGETIECTYELLNGTSQDIDEVQVSILESVMIKATDGEINWGQFRKVLGKTSLFGVQGGKKETFKVDMDIIPAHMRPYNFTGCSFVKLAMELDVECMSKTGDDENNLTGGFPIVVGTIPIRRQSRGSRSASIGSSLMAQPSGSSVKVQQSPLGGGGGARAQSPGSSAQALALPRAHPGRVHRIDTITAAIAEKDSKELEARAAKEGKKKKKPKKMKVGS